MAVHIHVRLDIRPGISWPNLADTVEDVRVLVRVERCAHRTRPLEQPREPKRMVQLGFERRIGPVAFVLVSGAQGAVHLTDPHPTVVVRLFCV
jgi:hypothetical protein